MRIWYNARLGRTDVLPRGGCTIVHDYLIKIVHGGLGTLVDPYQHHLAPHQTPREWPGYLDLIRFAVPYHERIDAIGVGQGWCLVIVHWDLSNLRISVAPAEGRRVLIDFGYKIRK